MDCTIVPITAICLVAAVLTQTHGNLPEGKFAVATSALLNCDVKDLTGVGYVVDSCGGLDEVQTVGHDGYCEVAKSNPITGNIGTVIMSCQHGQWTETHSQGLSHTREKRYVMAVAAGVSAAVGVGSLLYTIGCDQGWWCSKVEPVVMRPPSFSSNCPPADLKSAYTVPAGQNTMNVTWTPPEATDTDGSVEVCQVLGTPNGESFDGDIGSGRQHTALYVATNSDGLTANCFFSFTVKVLACGALLWPSNGQRTCTLDNILGSTCTFTCNEGYEVSDTTPTTCQNESSPHWTSEPSCQKLSCGPPDALANGHVTCNDHVYGSYCTVACDTGYRITGNIVYRCEANKQWSGSATCRDEQGPELSCLTPQTFYADRGSSSTSVTWQEPTADDRVDPNPSVIKTSDGIEQGVSVNAGNSKYVTYKAVDAEGNESPTCSIELRVQTISCGHPLDILLDTNLRVNCSMATYTHGDTCTLDCILNLPLEGVEEITCEREDIGHGTPRGRWDWGAGEQPFCKDIACPDIIPPKNGALVQDTIALRPMITMMCSEQFDIPDLEFNFNGIILCTDSGTWSPNLAKAPDCIEPFSSRGFLLPTELFYYSGTCGQDDNILEQFEGIVGQLNTIYPALCPADVTCSVVNPKVICGPVELRKKRSMSWQRSSRHFNDGLVPYVEVVAPHDVDRRAVSEDVLVLSCDIQVEFDSSGMTFKQTLNKADELQLKILKPAMQTMVSEGNYAMPNWVVGNLTTAEYGERFCDAGSTLSGRDTCKPCPPGRMEKDGKCHACPIGWYSEASGAVSCTKCPDGYSTRQESSESADNCTKVCVQGTYSPDTFAPCAGCKAGFYQAGVGQTTCNACPAGQTTTTSGSISISDCQYTDILLNGASGASTVAAIPQLDNMTLTFWTKTETSSVPNTQINIGDVLTVVITDSIEIETIDFTERLLLGPSSNKAWIHVAVTWDATAGALSAYYRGSLVDTKELPSLVRQPLFQDGQLRVTSGGDTGILVSGFSLDNIVFTDADVGVATTTCHASHDSAVVNMDNLNNADSMGISVLTPSTCSAVDACLSSPCGIHGKCSNDGEDYLCTCSGGWSGTSCQVPPDYCIDNKCDSTATCVNGENNYTCLCLPGHTGVFCETPPVDGGWSAWSGWSECSVSCNDGTQQRRRVCDSPTPGLYGRPCHEVNTETKTCTMSPCKKCKELNRGYGNLLQCTIDQEIGSQTCVVTCRPGYVLASGLHTSTFTCGVDTNFEWAPMQNVPDCLKPTHPEYYEISSTFVYSTDITPADEPLVIAALQSNIAHTPCFNSSYCETTIAFPDITGRRKRSAGSEMTLTFSIPLKDTSDLDLAAFENNGKISPALQELIDTLKDLGATADLISSSAGSLFDVTVNGITYNMDEASLSFDGSSRCRTGQVMTEGLCVDCPAGTYQSGDFCVLCGKNTYQEMFGQASCTSCPAGLATVTVGSKYRTDCCVVNHCDSQPCRNGGKCTARPEGYRCHCTDGWEGHTCSSNNGAKQIPIDAQANTAMILGISLGVGLLGLTLIVVGVIVLVRALRREKGSKYAHDQMATGVIDQMGGKDKHAFQLMEESGQTNI